MPLSFLKEAISLQNFHKLFWLHLLGISLGLRTDQIFGIYTLFLTFVILYLYLRYKEIPELSLPVPLSLIVGFQLFMWLISLFLDYYRIEWDLWDTGIHANNLVNLVKKGTYFSSVLDMPALRDHFTPGLFILAPFFKISPSILYLPLFRWISYALSFLFLSKALKILSFNEKTQMGLIFLWLYNLAIFHMFTFEFQGSNVSPVFIFAAFYFYLSNRHGLVFLTLFALIFFKENLVLGLFCFGLLYFFYSKRRVLGIFFIVSSLALAILILYLIYYVTQGVISQTGKWGPVELVPKKIFFVIYLASLFLFLPFLRLDLALVFISSMALSLVSRVPSMLELSFHYADLPSSFGMITTILALHSKKSLFEKLSRSWAKPIGLILFIWLHSKTPAQWIIRHLPHAQDIKIHSEVKALKKEIPEETPIASQTNLATLFIEYPNLKGFLLHDFEKLEKGEIPPNWPKGTILIYAENLNSWPLEKKSLKNLTLALLSKGFSEMKRPYLSELRVFALQ